VSEQEQAAVLAPERALRLLSKGEIEVEGLIPWSSNATLLVTVRDAALSTLAVYKPRRGERPLWDFEQGTLGRREVAAFLVSEALGWGFVPPTVLRRGPYGTGSLQLFVDAQEEKHFFAIQDDEDYREDLQRLAAFDALVNNADRKAGHCLVDHQGRLWAIDNALTFHPDSKLRTVIWDIAGQPLPAAIQADLREIEKGLKASARLGRALGQLLSVREVAALHRRLRGLMESRCFPEPGTGRVVPWPLI
jgi:uncharacterized repeat protein (TIGR03843 family)